MTMLTSLGTIDVVGAGVIALLGYGVVFLGLVALMVVVMIMGKFFAKKEAAQKATAQAAAPVEETAPVEAPLAPGTAGQLKIYDVPPQTAAMLMAIVAHKMGKPLNQLRFISIKEVK